MGDQFWRQYSHRRESHCIPLNIFFYSFSSTLKTIKMKCCIPEISWHNRDPVLSIDLQSQSPDNVLRLATGGTDSHVLMWSVTIGENGVGAVEFLSDLHRHQRAVNTVQFSPNGEMLASGDDEAVIILWTLKPKSDIPDIFSNKEGEAENRENWTVLKILRGHMEDVYDICWSPDSSQILSGSVDNTAILWDVAKGKSQAILSEHKGFVQGVAWDPKNQFVATLCSDRSCRVYSLKTKKVVQKMHQVQLGENGDEKPYKLFHDDTLKTFCRRLTFSPDGLILLTPCGLLEFCDADENEAKSGKKINATFAFSRNQLSKPAAYYPSADRYSVAVRCCPVIFQLREGSVSLYDIPYRMVFAVATQNTVLLYDTQQAAPFACIARIHYTRLTDLAWSANGRILVVSSTDGYCSIITFSEEELGRSYEPLKSEEAPNLNLPSSFQTLLQGEILQDNVKSIDEDFHLAYEDTHMTLDAERPTEKQQQQPFIAERPDLLLSPTSRTKSPRRVTLITLSSPKTKPIN